MIILVTGATAGFGHAIAERFVREGHKVIAAGRREDRLQALKAALGDALHPLVLDVTDRAAVDAAVKALPEAFAGIGVLVNNAGLALGMAPADKADFDDWARMIDTNVMGVVQMTHAVLPGMMARGGGHIVNMGSVAATYPYPGGNVYGATKAFVRQFSLNLRADLVGRLQGDAAAHRRGHRRGRLLGLLAPRPRQHQLDRVDAHMPSGRTAQRGAGLAPVRRACRNYLSACFCCD
jgi:3-hydroxy acid dehydrogenase/malonic semialdehyde reductase